MPCLLCSVFRALQQQSASLAKLFFKSSRCQPAAPASPFSAVVYALWLFPCLIPFHCTTSCYPSLSANNWLIFMNINVDLQVLASIAQNISVRPFRHKA